MILKSVNSYLALRRGHNIQPSVPPMIDGLFQMFGSITKLGKNMYLTCNQCVSYMLTKRIVV